MERYFLSAQELTTVTMALAKYGEDKDLDKCIDKIDLVVKNKFLKYSESFGVEWRSLKIPSQKIP